MAPTITPPSPFKTKQTTETQYHGIASSGKPVVVTAQKVMENDGRNVPLYGIPIQITPSIPPAPLEKDLPNPPLTPLIIPPLGRILTGQPGATHSGQPDRFDEGQQGFGYAQGQGQERQLEDIGEGKEGETDDNEALDMTPSARAKVLPWVTEMQASAEHHHRELPPSSQTGHDLTSAANLANAQAQAHSDYIRTLDDNRPAWQIEQEQEAENIARQDAESAKKARGVSVFNSSAGGGVLGKNGNGGQGDDDQDEGGEKGAMHGETSMKSDAAMSRGAQGKYGQQQTPGHHHAHSYDQADVAFGSSAAKPGGSSMPGQGGAFSPQGGLPQSFAAAGNGLGLGGVSWGQQATAFGNPTSPPQVRTAQLNQPFNASSMGGQAGSTPMMGSDSMKNPYNAQLPPMMSFLPPGFGAGIPPPMQSQPPVNAMAQDPRRPPGGQAQEYYGVLPANLNYPETMPAPQPGSDFKTQEIPSSTVPPGISQVAQAQIQNDAAVYALAQAQLLSNARASYEAMKKETEEREIQRQKALERLVGLAVHSPQVKKKVDVGKSRRGRDDESSSGSSESSRSRSRRRRAKKEKRHRSKSKSKHRKNHRKPETAESPLSPRYIPTTEGDIKTHEYVHNRRHKHDHDDVTLSTSETAQVPQPKRATQQTMQTQTSTSGPSFGHFGRPFSHQMPKKSGMDSGVPIVFLHDNLPSPFDIGGLGLGLGLDDLLPSPFGRSPTGEKRSAYVETVVDEDDLITRVDSRGPDEPVSQQDVTQSHAPSARESFDSVQGSPTPSGQPNLQPISNSQRRPPAERQVSRPLSRAFTTMSLVNQIVSDSRFHDSALCQLLHAAQDPSIGEAAKRAMRKAAKQRVVDLMDGGMPSQVAEQLYRSEKKSASRKPTESIPQSVDSEQEPPAWSQALFEMLAQTNARLDDLNERVTYPHQGQGLDSPVTQSEEGEAQARAALHNLLFPDIPVEVPNLIAGSSPRHESYHTAHTESQLPQYAQMPMPPQMMPPPQLPMQMPTTNPGFMGIRGWDPGMEMGLGSTPMNAPIPPLAPPAPPPPPPIIHIQAPTSRGQTTPRATSNREPERAMSDKSETVVPARGSPSRKDQVLQEPRSATQSSSHPQEHEAEPSYLSPYPKPWDIVTQRLFSWALVWLETDFVRTLEKTALGYQVDEFALTIYSMVIFKRNLRHRMCSIPSLPCDKLFVPPNMSDAINRAVHAKRFDDAAQILSELWWPFGFKEPPRVVIALAKHRNDGDHWAAHRFDMPTARLVTMSLSNQPKSLIDGRPFMWWHAIRFAFPEHNILHPDHLAQKTHRIITPDEGKDESSLMAMNAARNFLLGWRPERETDMKKLREMVWQEVKRLYSRKLAGKLIIDPGNDVADDF